MTTQEILQGVHDWTNGKIVYDISVAHPDGQGKPTPYADLTAALGTGGANIPQGLRKGGMSVKFIKGSAQGSDNKYVQFRYMGTAITGNPNPFLDTANWQGVDDEPTAGSKNLVESGGVKIVTDVIQQNIEKLEDVVQDIDGDTLYVSDKRGNIVAKIDSNGIQSIEVKAGNTNLSSIPDGLVDLYPNKLYVADSNGFVIFSIDSDGIHTTRISADNMFRNQWADKIIATYGDSVTALNGGDFTKPYRGTATNAKWAGKIANYFSFDKLHNRGIGSTCFVYGTHGEQVAWVRTESGVFVGRNDSYNYDNYEGHVTIPDNCTAIRGSGSSWLRITSMFPASIKDTIDIVLIQFHNDFHQDMDTPCAWIANSIADAEWASSTYYSALGGDYNITTVQGGIASTIMKLQTWMPNALLVLMTPISGVYINGNENVRDLENVESANMKKLANTIKDIAFRMSIPCIDVYGADGINSLNHSSFITDGIHPYNDDGCKKIARAIISGLINIIPNL